MGYLTKDIAEITEPKLISLSGVPNFVQFANKPIGAKTYQELTIEVKQGITQFEGSLIYIYDNNNVLHWFIGVTDSDKAGTYENGGLQFYLSSDLSETAENLRQALLSETWFSDYYNVTIPFDQNGSEIKNGRKLYIKGKGAGSDFNVIQSVSVPNYPENPGYTIDWINQISINNDSLSGEASTVEIVLDVYADAPYKLGEGNEPTETAKLGDYLASLRKTYAGDPVWFDLNGLFLRDNRFNTPPDGFGWFNTGTARNYRFVAKVEGYSTIPFYVSDLLFSLNGYSRISDAPDMSGYIELYQSTKLLTNKPRTNYIKGQREYLNFIYRSSGNNTDPDTFAVAYQVYSQSDKYLGVVYAHNITNNNLYTVNTCVLDIDTVLDQYPNAGIVRVALAVKKYGTTDYAIDSNNLEYFILPECLHTLRQFSFINKFGGWDSFNFDSGLKDEIKPGNDTFSKNITPSFRKGDSIETVYLTTLENTRTVEGAPVSDQIAEWLKELAASRVVLDGNGNYIIIEDFTLVVTDATKNMQKPTIKYRLSETYTNE